MIGIYKITSPTKKIYIGQSVDVKNRICKYKNAKCKNQTKLYHSILKYGFENHKFEILEYCNAEDLNEKERYYQDLYNSAGRNGLNCRLTSTKDKSGYVSQETREKLRQAMLGVKRPQEVKDKLRKANLGKKLSEETKQKLKVRFKGDKNPRFGKKLSFETRKLISENSKVKRKVFNSETGVIYNSIKEASEKEGIEYSKLRQYLRCKITKKTNIKYYEE